MAGLCWDRINFETNQIKVSRNQTRAGLLEVTKTHLVRFIPMNGTVKATLMNRFREQTSPRFVFDRGDGRPFDPEHFSGRQFTRALKRAGIERKIHFHCLRHTYASHFMMNNGNIYDLQKILGHTKIEMTMKYAHLSPEHLRKASEVVNFGSCEEFDSPLVAPQKTVNNENQNLSLVSS